MKLVDGVVVRHVISIVFLSCGDLFVDSVEEELQVLFDRVLAFLNVLHCEYRCLSCNGPSWGCLE